MWILLKQETVSGSGISRAICTSLHLAPDRYSRQHPPLSFLQTGRPSCRPTNRVKALNANRADCTFSYIDKRCALRTDLVGRGRRGDERSPTPARRSRSRRHTRPPCRRRVPPSPAQRAAATRPAAPPPPSHATQTTNSAR